MASSPSRRRWKKDGRWATTTVATMSPAHSATCFGRVIGLWPLLCVYFGEVTSGGAQLSSSLVVACPWRSRGRARARPEASAGTHRDRLPHVPGGGERGPAAGVAAHL